jgi:hypothetical protein
MHAARTTLAADAADAAIAAAAGNHAGLTEFKLRSGRRHDAE